MKWLQKEGTSGKNLPMLLLLAVGIIEFIFITLESQFSGIGYYLAETYLIVPCLLLLGYSLREKQSPFARKRLLLAVAAASWFVIVQSIHKLSGMENHPMATVFFVYLMAFPFAALADDRENAGLRLIGGMFVTASLVLVFYTLLLLLNRIPAGLAEEVFWDGARLNALWHPNLAACYFMISIGFTAAFCAQAQKRWVKALLVLAIGLQFVAMALTNCRTTLLLTGALLGGILFFLIYKGGWKRLLLGLLAAAVMLAGSFKLSGAIYRWNNDRLVASGAVMVEEYAETEEYVEAEEYTEAETFVETVEDEESAATAETVQYTEEILSFEEETEYYEEDRSMDDSGLLLGDNEQKSLAEDLWSLNGRTQIWTAALTAIRDNKDLALWGTEYVGTVISVYHWFDVVHAHNSWMEVLMRMGLPGLVLSLAFTVISVWSAARLVLRKDTQLWKKIIAMMTMCVLASGFLEPYLFITNVYYHIMDFMFFFCTGYLDFWCSHKKEAKR